MADTAMMAPFAFRVSNTVDAAELEQWRGSHAAMAACEVSCTRNFGSGWCTYCRARYNGSLHCVVDGCGLGWYNCDWFC